MGQFSVIISATPGSILGATQQLEDDTDFLYKCTAHYAPQFESCLAWDDPAVGIEWPLDGIAPKLSAKDAVGLSLDQVTPFP